MFAFLAMLFPPLLGPGFATAKWLKSALSAAWQSGPGDTPREVAIPAEPARTCDISADNAAIFRDQRPAPAPREGAKAWSSPEWRARRGRRGRKYPRGTAPPRRLRTKP